MTNNASKNTSVPFKLDPESEFANQPNLVQITAELNDKVSRLLYEIVVPTLFKRAVKDTLSKFDALSYHVGELWYQMGHAHLGESISAFDCSYVEKESLRCAFLIKSLPFIDRNDQNEIVAELEKIANVAKEVNRSIKK